MQSRAGFTVKKHRFRVLTVICASILAFSVAGATIAASRIQWFNPHGQAEIDPSVLQSLQPEFDRLGHGLVAASDELTSPPLNAQAIEQIINAHRPSDSARYAMAISSIDSDSLIYGNDAETPMTPASTMKIITAIAAIHQLGADHRLSTTTALNDNGDLILVGGGDPLLASSAEAYPWRDYVQVSNMDDLADSTVRSLNERSIARVTLGYDSSAFGSQMWHPDWDPLDRVFVAPISSLSVDEGAGANGLDDPAIKACEIFAQKLRDRGIEVHLGGAMSSAGATTIAEISSARIGVLVQEMLFHSDNYIADMLYRLVASARGKEPTFEGGAHSVQEICEELGIWDERAVLVDGSGLSTNNRLTAAMLTRAIRHILENKSLRFVAEAMPTSASTGTLRSRFAAEDAQQGRGDIRAKTGSLSNVSSLAGYLVTNDHAVIVFALIVNDFPDSSDPRSWLDRVSAELAGCHCAQG